MFCHSANDIFFLVFSAVVVAIASIVIVPETPHVQVLLTYKRKGKICLVVCEGITAILKVMKLSMR